MTVFVVSLFLPYTINFEAQEAEKKKPSQEESRPSYARKASVLAPVPNLSSSLQARNVTLAPTPPDSPPNNDDPEDFFLQGKKYTASNDTGTNHRKLLSLSDPHSPAWGRTTSFVQPPSQAGDPPHPSILKHVKIDSEKQDAENLGAQPPPTSRRRRRMTSDKSQDKFFAHADWTVEKADQGNGGLRNAVNAALEDGSLDHCTWVGTLGMPTDILCGTQRKQDIEDKLETDNDSLVVFCKDSDFDGHYSHYCKQILWPVFHYQIPDNPKSKAYEDHSWVYYEKVNQDFADKIVKNYKRGDVIWVHDYHLLLVPSMVRQKLPDAQIGFFLHVAFPSSEVFRCLAVRKELLEGVLGSNLIGFQTSEYARHFLQTCTRILCTEVTNEGVLLEDRFVNVFSLAIGIDPIALGINRKEEEVLLWVKEMQKKYKGKRLIVARDKLDHVRGVRQKLLAYELFLNKYPEWREKVVLIQVATSTTEQAELDATVSDIVTRVNSRNSSLTAQPLVFLKQDISYAQYLALLTVADSLMITSLREGMNLTSHEFIACQDGQYTENKHGPLILSEFTGSSTVFGGSELPVNPWDYRQCAEQIHNALTMKPEEREKRWTSLNNVVTHHTAAHWFKTFTDKLATVWTQQQERGGVSVPRLSVPELGKRYKDSEKRLFILDYEGTLAPWGSPDSIILTSPQRVLDTLNELILDEKNIVYVMSGRSPQELEPLFSRVPNLGLIAENGCFVRDFGSTDWNLDNIDGMKGWMKSYKGILEYWVERTPGSSIECRHCSLIFHYDQAEDHEGAARQAGECVSHINESGEDQRVHAIPVDGAVIVESMDWTKATAAAQILDRMKDKASPDFLMVAGDDREDEPIFRWANALGRDGTVKSVTTVSIGSRSTEAMSTLSQGVTGVLAALQKLASLSPLHHSPKIRPEK